MVWHTRGRELGQSTRRVGWWVGVFSNAPVTPQLGSCLSLSWRGNLLGWARVLLRPVSLPPSKLLLLMFRHRLFEDFWHGHPQLPPQQQHLLLVRHGHQIFFGFIDKEVRCALQHSSSPRGVHVLTNVPQHLETVGAVHRFGLLAGGRIRWAAMAMRILQAGPRSRFHPSFDCPEVPWCPAHVSKAQRFQVTQGRRNSGRSRIEYAPKLSQVSQHVYAPLHSFRAVQQCPLRAPAAFHHESQALQPAGEGGKQAGWSPGSASSCPSSKRR
jgi:hypothetical protein